MNIAQRVRTWILHKPKAVAASILLVTFAFIPGMLNIHINDDLKASMPKGSEVRIANDHLEENFGSADTLILSVAMPEGTIYTQERLSLIRDLTDAFLRVKGVARVQSLANVDIVDRIDGSMFTHPLIDEAPTTDEQVQEIERKAHRDPMLSRSFVSESKTDFAIYIDPRKDATDPQLLGGVEEVIAPYKDQYKISFAGLPVLRTETTRSIQKDMLTLIPGVFVVLALVLFWALRSMHGLLITLMVVGLSIVPPTGLMGYLGIDMTAGNNMFPILILGTACADSIHVLSMLYLSLRQGKTMPESVERITRELWLPVFLTSVTTAVGFLTLTASNIPAMKALGALVAVGVVWAWLLSTILLPAMLLLLPVPEKVSNTEHGLEKRLLPLIHMLATKHAIPTAIAIVAASSVAAFYLIPQVKLEPRYEVSFPEDHKVRQDYMAFDHNYGGSTPIELLIHADPRDADLLKAVYKLEKELSKIESVGSSDSVAQMVARAYETIRNEGEKYRVIPDTRQQVAQVMFMAAGNPDNFERFVNRDYSAFRVTIRVESMGIDRMRSVIAQVEQLIDQHLPDDVEIEQSGKALFDLELAQQTANSARNSILMSVGIVFLICWIFLRSFGDGVLGMVPIIFAVAMNFAFMGALAIGLSVATAIVSSIVIGVGVDYAIHFLARWRHEKEVVSQETDLEGLDKFDRILSLTLEESGPPILFNAIAVALGLGVLLGSSFLPIRNLGLLAVVSMFSTSMAALLVLPLLKRIFYRKTTSGGQ